MWCDCLAFVYGAYYDLLACHAYLVCSGNGGPPSRSSCLQYCGSGNGVRDWAGCQKCIAQPYSYTRITAYNATDLLWEQYSNADGSLIDSWTLHQELHGPFANVTATIGYTYFFQNASTYAKYNTSSDAVMPGYPHAYGQVAFPGIPSDLDAVVPHYNDGKSVYFFKGNRYWKYNLMASAVEPGYPHAYGGDTKRFPGVPADLDAAVSHPYDGKSVYFFKGDRYWKYDMTTGRVMHGYPIVYGKTSTWHGIPADVDAAMSHWSDGASVFFFKGSVFWKFNVIAGALYPGYPKAFGNNKGGAGRSFGGVPRSMAAGFNRCGPFGSPQFGASCRYSY